MVTSLLVFQLFSECMMECNSCRRQVIIRSIVRGSLALSVEIERQSYVGSRIHPVSTAISKKSPLEDKIMESVKKSPKKNSSAALSSSLPPAALPSNSEEKNLKLKLASLFC